MSRALPASAGRQDVVADVGERGEPGLQPLARLAAARLRGTREQSGQHCGAVAAPEMPQGAVARRVRADAHPGSVADGAAREETRVNTMHCGSMASALPIIVYPPDEEGSRRVRVDGEILGRAYGLQDLTEFLRRAGLEDPDEAWVRASTLIDWRGGGPDAWTH